MVSPYGAVHNTTANLDNRDLQQETVDAIVNLATSTASDRAAIVQLTVTVTVARLTTEFVMVNEKIMVALQEKRAIWSSQGGRQSRSRSKSRNRNRIRRRSNNWCQCTHNGGFKRPRIAKTLLFDLHP